MKKFVSYLYIVLAGVYTTFFSIQNTFAEERRTITFSSGYLEEYYTNRQIANFGVELFENIDFVLDKANKIIRKGINDEYSKSTLSCILYLIDYYFISSFGTSYHEFGHAMRDKAVGYDYVFIKSSADDYDDTDDIKANNKNFFKYFLDKIYYIKLSGGATMRLTDFENGNDKLAGIDEQSFYKRSLKEGVIISAAGLNNETYFQEKMTERTYLTNEITISNYLFKLDSVVNDIYYAKNSDKSGDPYKIESFYKGLGINANRKDMARAFLISALLSQTTYGIFYNMLFKQSIIFTPLQYKGFIFPDVFPYITTRGISYRIKSAYRYSDDLIFRFGIEFIAYGKSTQELIFGINTKLIKDNRLDLLTVFGKDGINIETTYTIPIAKHFNINLDFDLHSTKSLYGERNAYRLYELKDPYIDTFIGKTTEDGEEKTYKMNYKQYKTKKPISYSYYLGLSLSYVF